MSDSLADILPRPLVLESALRIPADADKVWAIVGNIGDMTLCAGLVERIDVVGHGVGSTRRIFLGGDVSIMERVDEYNETDRYYVYRIIDVGPLNFTNYVACARITPAGPDSCIASWVIMAQPLKGEAEAARTLLQGNIDHVLSALLKHFSE